MPSRLSAAAILLLAALPARAEWQPNFRFGLIELHPFYEFKGVYDDNIYRVAPDSPDGTRAGCSPGNGNACSGGVRGSWFTTNEIGFKAALSAAEIHRFGAGYSARFDTYDRQSAANNAIHQTADFDYSYKGPVLNARAWDSFVHTQDPPYNPNSPGRALGSVTTGGELVGREQRWQNIAGIYLEYALGRQFFFGAEAQDSRQKYRRPDLAYILDNSVESYGFKTGYKFQPKTRIFGSLHRGMTRYSGGRRGTNHKDWSGDIGLEGEFTAKIKGRVQTGITRREYESDGLNISASSDTTNWTFLAGLTYKPVERTSIDLSLSRGLAEATGVRFYISNSAALSVTHAVGRFSLRANAGVVLDKYCDSQTVPAGTGRTASRRDDTYTGGLGLSYKILNWLTASADYHHTRRHSIFTWEYNYRDNQTSAGIKAAF